MALIETGRVCVITKGADAGKQAVIKSVTDKNFVVIAGEHVKERRINVKHIEPVNAKTSVPAGKTIKAKEKKTQETKQTPAKSEKKPKPVAKK
ncbi:50S ribosomal protein L14e [Candidatus Micrarchaeota archaeon]|nr:50S ribosomal protein L14e [Candidatus Micrarchaeota archaeon]